MSGGATAAGIGGHPYFPPPSVVSHPNSSGSYGLSSALSALPSQQVIIGISTNCHVLLKSSLKLLFETVIFKLVNLLPFF